MTALTQTQLRRRPYWLFDDIRSIRCGDWMIRYSQGADTLSAGDISSVNSLTATKRLGGTDFLNLANRFAWHEMTSDGLHMLTFGTYAESRTDEAYIDGGGHGAGSPSVNDVGGIGFEAYYPAEERPESVWLFGAFRMMQKAMGPRVTSVGDVIIDKPIYNGSFGLHMIGSTTGPTSHPRDSSKRLEVSLHGASAQWKFAVERYTDGGVQKVDCLLPVGVGGIVPSDTTGTLGRPQISGASPSLDGEHPAAGSFRSDLGWTMLKKNGLYRLPVLGRGFLMDAGPLHGLHQSIKAIVLSDPTSAKYVLASFKKSEMLALLNTQKSLADEPIKSQINGLITSITTNVSTNSVFNLLVSNVAMGPYDIYDMQTIRKALDDGADIADIADHQVGSKKLGEWQSLLKTVQGQKALLWIDKDPESVGARGLTIGPQATTPYYQVLNDSPATGEAVVLDDHELEQCVLANPTHVTIAAIKGDLIGRYGVKIVTQAEADLANGIVTQTQSHPWEDLPSVWLQRGTMLNWQPVANSLLAGIMEPSAPFLA